MKKKIRRGRVFLFYQETQNMKSGFSVKTLRNVSVSLKNVASIEGRKCEAFIYRNDWKKEKKTLVFGTREKPWN